MHYSGLGQPAGDAPTVHLGLEYDPWNSPDNSWSGATYADYLAEVAEAGPSRSAEPATASMWEGTAGPGALIAWALGLAALYALLNRTWT